MAKVNLKWIYLRKIGFKKHFYLTKLTFLISSLLLLSLSFPDSALAISSFPGAEGFGANSVGGRGGTVYEVTNTNDSGSGSLRACVEASGPRTCVFKTGGLITINSSLTISNPYITIAGQTAPGGGITIKTASGGEVLPIKTHDVVVRYISARPGPGGDNHASQIANSGGEIYNVIVDHSTFSWGVDSNIETWYRVLNTTIQWSLISEGLNNSTHSKGAHSKGLMIGGYAGSESKNSPGSENISVLNNLMANNVDRNPLIQMCGPAQVINNVTYNAGTTFSHQQLNCKGSNYEGTSYVNWINNYHKKGPSGANTDLKIIPSDGGVCSSGKVYMSGNVGNNGTWTYSFSGSCDSQKASILVDTPVSAPSVATTTAQDAYNQLISDGGAGNSRGIDCNGNWFNRRDTIDQRIINDVKNGTGKIIDDPSDVGGWITPSSGTGCQDSDHDGMPDTWESNHGLNPNDKNDGSQVSSSGYTNLENYLNGQNGGTVNPTTPPTSSKTGDVNNDGQVNIIDIGLIIDFYGQNNPSNQNTDINKDGMVNIVDIGLVIDNYGN